MRVLLVTSLLFALAMSLHLIVWRLRRPKYQTKSLLVVFYATLILGICSEIKLGSITGIELIHSFVCYTALTLAYVMFYSGLEVDSPTLTIMQMLDEADSKGVPLTDFYQSLSDDVLVKPRIRDLVRDGMVTLETDGYRMTPKGQRFINIMNLYFSVITRGRGTL